MANLDAQIEGFEARLAAGALDANGIGGLIDMWLQRGQIRGSHANRERAWALAGHLARNAPGSAPAYLAVARTCAAFHRFAQALDALDAALRTDADPYVVGIERISILQAIGEYEQALTLLRALRGADEFSALGTLAVLLAASGDVAAAEAAFEECRRAYRGVSPIPLALLDFQRGHMWMECGVLESARRWFESAHRLLPQYVAAETHLAEIEMETSELDGALVRLRRLADTSEDPDVWAALAHALSLSGDRERAAWWRAKAAACYDRLLEQWPEAYADHAARFELNHGGDLVRARALADLNVRVRPTAAAKRLLARAMERIL